MKWLASESLEGLHTFIHALKYIHEIFLVNVSNDLQTRSILNAKTGYMLVAFCS